jgi:hypothetical protein
VRQRHSASFRVRGATPERPIWSLPIHRRPTESRRIPRLRDSPAGSLIRGNGCALRAAIPRLRTVNRLRMTAAESAPVWRPWALEARSHERDATTEPFQERQLGVRARVRCRRTAAVRAAQAPDRDHVRLRGSVLRRRRVHRGRG